MTPKMVTGLLAAVWVITSAVVLGDSIRNAERAHQPYPLGATIALVLLAILIVLALIHIRRQLDLSAKAKYEESVRALDRVVSITEVALSDLPLDALLEEMAARLQVSLEADLAAVLMLEHDNEVVVRAASGPADMALHGERLALGQGFAGRVAAEARTMTATNLASVVDLIPLVAERMASAAATPLCSGSKVIGVLLVANANRRIFDAADLRLLELAADRLAQAFEGERLADAEHRASLGAEHARRHLRLLGDASRIFMQSVDDYEPSLRKVIDLALRDLASFGAIVLADQRADLDVLVAKYAAPSDARDARDVQLPPELLETIRTAMAEGHSRLATCADPLHLATPEGSPDATMQALGLTTYVVAPILVRGLAFGVIVLGTAAPLRGFRRSDQSAIEELTRRAALAIEASLLYREALASARVSSGHLQRLRSVLDVWLGLTVTQDPNQIVRLAADGACRVLGADAVDVLLCDGSGARGGNFGPVILGPRALEILAAIDRPSGPGSTAAALLPQADREALGYDWVAAPIRPSTGAGGIILVRAERLDFTAEDESLLVLLSQIVSACLANAALHLSTQQGEARVSALLAASPAPIIALSDCGEPIAWNPAASAVYGWPSSGEPQLPHAVAEAVKTLTHLARNGAETCQVECQWHREDGSRSLLLMLAPVRAPSGEIEGFILVTTDDTSRRRLADQFHQSQRLEVVGRLAGGVAHDFNNLLTVILGYTDGLLRKFDDEDPIRRRIEAIHKAGSHAAELTKELLTISRHQVVRPVVIEPAVFVNEIAGMLERILGDNVSLNIVTTDEPLAVRIDPMQLEQVMLNLAANARDAMPDGGTLTVGVGVPDQQLLRRGVAATVDRVTITVADAGTGMDPATLEHCLEPFFTTKQAGRGTGLGLAAVLGIVDQSGGDLFIDSEMGVGTTVAIVLPAVHDVADQPEISLLPTPKDPVESRMGTVVVVDDDLDIRSLVTMLLRDRGYKVLAAHSGPAALQMVADYDGAIDLLLTDVSMPAMSGVELAQEVRARLDVPVVFMSGFAEEFGLGQLSDDFEASFIAKPFTPDDLVREVDRVIAGLPLPQPSKR